MVTLTLFYQSTTTPFVVIGMETALVRFGVVICISHTSFAFFVVVIASFFTASDNDQRWKRVARYTKYCRLTVSCIDPRCFVARECQSVGKLAASPLDKFMRGLEEMMAGPQLDGAPLADDADGVEEQEGAGKPQDMNAFRQSLIRQSRSGKACSLATTVSGRTWVRM